MSIGRGEADFSEATHRIIRERAAYRCIVPTCEAVTIGPGASTSETANTGTACHIFSAAKNGPRGREGLSDEQLRNPENGVWACATHGRLIDTNAGNAYPATLLHSWKELLEARIKRERDGQPTKHGWLEEFKAENTVLFEDDSVLNFGQLTLIQGPALGKTALCDWIVALLGGPMSSRWTKANVLILTSLIAFVPDKRVVSARINEVGLSAYIDGAERAELPVTLNCTYVREGSRDWPLEEDDDVLLGRLFSVDPGIIRRLIPDIQRAGTPWGRSFEFVQEARVIGHDDNGDEIYSDREKVWVLRHGGPSGLPMRVLSGSEAAQLLIEFGAALARERSVTKASVLILDGSEWPFDSSNMDSYGRYLANQPFQTVMTAVGGWNPADPTCWKEWKRYVLRGKWREAAIVEVPW